MNKLDKQNNRVLQNSFEEVEKILVEKIREAQSSDEREIIITQLKEVQKSNLEQNRFERIELVSNRNQNIKLYFNMALSISLIIGGVMLSIFNHYEMGAFLVGGGFARIGLKEYVEMIFNKIINNQGNETQ